MADNNIALGVKQPEPVNYLGQMAQMMALKATQNEMQGNDQMRAAYGQGSGDWSDPAFKRQMYMANPSKAALMEKEYLAGQGTAATTAKTKVDTIKNTIDIYQQQLGGIKNSADAAKWAEGFYNSGPAGDFLAKTFPLDKFLATIPQTNDPAALEQWKRHVALDAKQLYTSADAELKAATDIKTTGMTNATSRANNADTIANSRYQFDNPHPTVQTIGDEVYGVQAKPGATPTVTPLSRPRQTNALTAPATPAPSMVNNMLADKSPTALTSVPPPVMTPQAFDTSRPAPAPAAAPQAWNIQPKPTWDEKTQSWLTPPSPGNPKGTVTPMPEASAGQRKRDAQQALQMAGFDPQTGKDDVSALIKESTSGAGQRGLAAGKEFITGESTTGQEAIARLASRANAITLAMLNGHLGAGFSNEDREFVLSRLGDVANPNKGSSSRLAAWQDAVGYLSKTAGYSTPSTGQSSGGAVDNSNPLLQGK